MKYILILLALVGFYQYGYKPSEVEIPLAVNVSHTGQYVAVYGRNSCPITKRTLAYMAKHGIEYTYLDIDEKAISSNLHKRMKSQGISTRRYNLPVVDFSGELSVRPDKTKILAGSKG